MERKVITEETGRLGDPIVMVLNLAVLLRLEENYSFLNTQILCRLVQIVY